MVALALRMGFACCGAGRCRGDAWRGGCLSIFAEALGTPYAPEVAAGGILFLEDIGTKPYQWDRMLLHLRYAGMLEGVRGIVFGDMRQCVSAGEEEFLERAILHALRDFEGPIAIGLRSGHVDGAERHAAAGGSREAGSDGGGESGGCTFWRLRLRSSLESGGDSNLTIMQTSKHIHLIGICGTAMASLAGMLQARGHRVTGSDAAAYPPMSDLLAGIEDSGACEPYAGATLSLGPTWWWWGMRSRGAMWSWSMCWIRGFRSARWRRFCTMSFWRGASRWWWRGRMARRRRPACWRGSMRWLRGRMPEFAPSFLIGGVAENFGTSFKVRPTRPFMLEGDEYDTAFFDKGPKFLHYFPDAAILTHVEFDHADIYADLAAVKTAFKRLVNLVPRRGRDGGVRWQRECERVRGKAFCPVERYGFAADSYWRVSEHAA